MTLSKSMTWTEHVACIRAMRTFCSGNLQREDHPKRPGRRRKKYVINVDWINLHQDMVQQKAAVNAIMNFLVLFESGNLLSR